MYTNDVTVKNDLNNNAYIFRYSDISVSDNSLNFMIIDDNDRDIKEFEKLLDRNSDLKFSISQWHNAHEAIAGLKSGMIFPDLIILDLILPDMNGKTILKKLKEIRTLEFVPIVIYSSMSNIENTLATGSLGASAFFGKPLNVELFQAFVKGQDV